MKSNMPYIPPNYKGQSPIILPIIHDQIKRHIQRAVRGSDECRRAAAGIIGAILAREGLSFLDLRVFGLAPETIVGIERQSVDDRRAQELALFTAADAKAGTLAHQLKANPSRPKRARGYSTTVSKLKQAA